MCSFFPACQHGTAPCAGDSYGYSVDTPRNYGSGPKSLVFQTNCRVLLFFCGRELVSCNPRWKGGLGYLIQLLPLPFDQRSYLGPLLSWSEIWTVFQMKEIGLFLLCISLQHCAIWCDSQNAATFSVWMLGTGMTEDRPQKPAGITRSVISQNIS